MNLAVYLSNSNLVASLVTYIQSPLHYFCVWSSK